MDLKKRRSKMIPVLFVTYSVLLVWIILFKLSFSAAEWKAMTGVRSINFIPFYYKDAVGFHFAEVMKNVIIFIPFGLYLKMMDVENKNAVLYVLVFSFALELCQFVFKMGASDITDILTNTAGTAAGVLFYLLLIKVFKKPDKINKVLGTLAFIATIAFIALLLLLVTAN